MSTIEWPPYRENVDIVTRVLSKSRECGLHIVSVQYGKVFPGRSCLFCTENVRLPAIVGY